MRLPFLVYGVLYVVVEMVGHSLETVGWDRVSPLVVAAALVDALLVIVIAIAALVMGDVARRRWVPVLRAWQQQRPAWSEEPGWAGAGGDPIEVTSWRAGDERGPLALPAGPTTYGAAPRGRPYPGEPGRLL